MVSRRAHRRQPGARRRPGRRRGPGRCRCRRPAGPPRGCGRDVGVRVQLRGRPRARRRDRFQVLGLVDGAGSPRRPPVAGRQRSRGTRRGRRWPPRPRSSRSGRSGMAVGRAVVAVARILDDADAAGDSHGAHRWYLSREHHGCRGAARWRRADAGPMRSLEDASIRCGSAGNVAITGLGTFLGRRLAERLSGTQHGLDLVGLDLRRPLRLTGGSRFHRDRPDDPTADGHLAELLRRRRASTRSLHTAFRRSPPPTWRTITSSRRSAACTC